MKKLMFLMLVVVQISLCQQSVVFKSPYYAAPLSVMEKERSQSLRFQIPSDESSEPGGKKNIATAALYSFLLPGMGELYAGQYGMGKYFTIAEGALWITLGSVQWYATWLQDGARNFAAQHAQVTLDGKSDQYFSDIGNFDNTYQYNQEILRERQPFKVYNPNSSYAWNWDSDANREIYRQQRVSSDNMFNNTRFVAAAIAINHLVSAINAARLVISHNKEVDHAELLELHASVIGDFGHADGICISFSKSF